MDHNIVIAKLRAQRERWVTVGEGKRVRIIRPPEAEMVRFIDGKGMRMVDHVRDYVTGWEGITEADLFGEAVGSADAVPFSPELWAEVVSDRLAWVQQIGGELLRAMGDHRLSLQAAEKN